MNLTPVSNDTLCSNSNNNEVSRKVRQYNSAPKLTKKVLKMLLTIISNFYPIRRQMFNDYLKKMIRD